MGASRSRSSCNNEDRECLVQVLVLVKRIEVLRGMFLKSDDMVTEMDECIWRLQLCYFKKRWTTLDENRDLKIRVEKIINEAVWGW